MYRHAAWVTPLLLILAAPYAVSGWNAADGSAVDVAPIRLTVAVEAVQCPDGYDNGIEGDDGCLAYDGRIPGPTLVFQQGDRVELTLENRVWDTVQNLSLPGEVRARLLGDNVSLHRHGVALEQSEDGVPAYEGTRIIDSTIGPNATVTYTFRTPFPGFWHYHDHVHGTYLESGQHRGLFGSMLVLPPGESTGAVLDLHLTDEGPNGGLGLDATVAAGERFDLSVVGLGNFWWAVTLEDPSGDVVGTIPDIGPGVSRGITVAEAEPGTYTWTATSPFFPDAFTGEVVAE